LISQAGVVQRELYIPRRGAVNIQTLVEIWRSEYS
jgi:hypothetical protein